MHIFIYVSIHDLWHLSMASEKYLRMVENGEDEIRKEVEKTVERQMWGGSSGGKKEGEGRRHARSEAHSTILSIYRPLY